jgi:hypothetical protein
MADMKIAAGVRQHRQGIILGVIGDVRMIEPVILPFFLPTRFNLLRMILIDPAHANSSHDSTTCSNLLFPFNAAFPVFLVPPVNAAHHAIIFPGHKNPVRTDS